MKRFLILANNGSKYHRDPRWPKYNVAFLSWFLSFAEYEVVSVLNQPKTILLKSVESFISNASPNDMTFIYIAGIGGKRNGVNTFLSYEYSNIDEGVVDIGDILSKFQGKPVVVFIDVFSPRTSFQKFNFTDCAIQNCYIAFSCSSMQGPVADGTTFTGKIIHSLFGHSGTTLSHALDCFQIAMNQNQKIGKTACIYDNMQQNSKQVNLQGVLNNQNYQSQKSEPTDFTWVCEVWEKLQDKED